VLSGCPSAAEVAAVASVLKFSFEADPSGPRLVCRGEDGSADLTLLQKNAYEAILLMDRIQFDVPLSWTNKRLFEWFVGLIHGLRFRSDIEYSSCCEPAGVINIQTTNLCVTKTQKWLDAETGCGLEWFYLLLAHEARHADGKGHTCGPWDQTIQELGAWGVQYELLILLGRHSDPRFITTTASPPPGMRLTSTDYYRGEPLWSAEDFRTQWFCGEKK
jgi:hypothetical protein